MKQENALKANLQPAPLDVPNTCVGGLEIAALDLKQTAEQMMTLARAGRRGDRPWILTSANGEVVSRCASSPRIADLFRTADMISADGQPLIVASYAFSRRSLPERVATTDLFHEVAKLASGTPTSFYFLGATEQENRRAVDTVRRLYPGVNIAGQCHGYLGKAELHAKVREINSIAPDILWVSFGVPREQEFCAEFASDLCNVGVVKTSGGLFNFLSGTRSRAPLWMQRMGLEWAYRIWLEPRRLFWRYFTTNPHALLLLMTRSR